MSTLNLPDKTADGQARAEALDRRHRPDVEPTSMVSYLSHGRVLVIGEEAGALDTAGRLDEELIPTLFLPADMPPATSTSRLSFVLIERSLNDRIGVRIPCCP